MKKGGNWPRPLFFFTSSINTSSKCQTPRGEGYVLDELHLPFLGQYTHPVDHLWKRYPVWGMRDLHEAHLTLHEEIRIRLGSEPIPREVNRKDLSPLRLRGEFCSVSHQDQPSTLRRTPGRDLLLHQEIEPQRAYQLENLHAGSDRRLNDSAMSKRAVQEPRSRESISYNCLLKDW